HPFRPQHHDNSTCTKTDRFYPELHSDTDIPNISNLLCSNRHPQSFARHEMSARIHLLGIGNIGCFVAHALRTLPDPPVVTLKFHRRRQVDEFMARNGEITVKRENVATHSDGYKAEFYRARELRMETYGGIDMSLISNCIVTTKACDATSALSYVHQRMNRDSTLVLLQNGMGILEQMQRSLFPDPTRRPNILLGVNTHGCFSEKPFSVVHAGVGTILLGLVPHPLYPDNFISPHEACTPEILERNPHTESTAEILRLLHAAPSLSCSSVAFSEIVLAQLEKLAINCAINPLTAIFECLNGDILALHIRKLLESVIFECANVFSNIPIIQSLESDDRFTKGGLLRKVSNIARATASNKSSMLQDIQRRRSTEIEYINGYIESLGKQLNVATPNNTTLRRLIVAKSQMAASGRTVHTMNVSQSAERFMELVKQD
ncbi:putative 2-dehydropantoate 2-reductase, partial [Neolecta irregularis DAH-3]